MKGVINISSGVFKLMDKEIYERDEPYLKESGFRLMTDEEIIQKLGYVPAETPGEKKFNPESFKQKLEKVESEMKKIKSENLKLKRENKKLKETPSEAKQNKSAND